VVTVDLLVLAVLLLDGEGLTGLPLQDLIVWTLLATTASLAPVPSGRGAWLAFDLPIVLGAGLVFGPVGAGVVGLVGAFDARELRREMSVSRAMFNRAQVSLSGIAGAATFRFLGGELDAWPDAALLGLAALGADCLVNYVLVGLSTSITYERSLVQVLGDMYVGTRTEFLLAYVLYGFLAVLVAEGYVMLGLVGLVAFAVPLLLTRKVFRHRHELEEADALLEARRDTVRKFQSTIAEERRDERMVLAGELHDEVLPPLYKVHLMGQVLKQDLNNGRLLELDDDIPELLEATQVAQSALRGIVGNLRRSSLGPGGLIPTIQAAARQLESAGSPAFTLELDDVPASREIQLVLYQVAREAMGNAAKYSKASRIAVRLSCFHGDARLVVIDDGVGFDSSLVDRDQHFGLQLVAERVEAIGGRVVVDSGIGRGTTIAAAVPLTSIR
jgi:signal transduction histidine kinase